MKQRELNNIIKIASLLIIAMFLLLGIQLILDVNWPMLVIQAIPTQLLDIELELGEKIISDSNELIAYVGFKNFGTDPVEINLTYSILGESENEVHKDAGLSIVETEKSIIKRFDDLNLQPGKYVFVLRIKYADVTEGFEQDFEIKEKVSFIDKYFVYGLIGFFVLAFFLAILFTRKKIFGHNKKLIKKIDIRIKKELSSNQTMLLLVPSTIYNDLITDMLKSLSKKSICYVTLNKTYTSIKKFLNKRKIDMENIVFIDASLKSVKKIPKQTKNCYFMNSGSLTELSILIGKLLRKKFEYLIFDSLSNLMIYQDKRQVATFISNLVNKIKETKTKAVFYVIDVKEHDELIKETSMFVDKTIDLSKLIFREKPSK